MSLLIDHSVVSCANIRGVAQHYVRACATERMLSLANGVACDLVIGVYVVAACCKIAKLFLFAVYLHVFGV